MGAGGLILDLFHDVVLGESVIVQRIYDFRNAAAVDRTSRCPCQYASSRDMPFSGIVSFFFFINVHRIIDLAVSTVGVLLFVV